MKWPLLGEVPFGKYYGSVDATPLFVMLAGAYFDRTGDRVFLEKLWPHVERALRWIDEYGDVDGDGFVEYSRHSGKGLVQQGWKDSNDSVFQADGKIADPPIALCEVQGYVYAAKLAAAKLTRILGNVDQCCELELQAENLRTSFEEKFWSNDLGMYALALDGHKQPCKVRTSNAGHCLFTGIASSERARRVAETLMAEDFFTGWGIRTVATTEARYNPLSYHNGSVWPHDNSVIASGMAKFGFPKDGGTNSSCSARSERRSRAPSITRVVLWIEKTADRRSDSLSGGVLATGMGSCRAVSDSRSLPGNHGAGRAGTDRI